MCIYLYLSIYIYIYIYMYMVEKVGDFPLSGGELPSSSTATMQGISPHLFRAKLTPSPPIKSLDFRGFDSSRLLILRGRNSHVR